MIHPPCGTTGGPRKEQRLSHVCHKKKKKRETTLISGFIWLGTFEHVPVHTFGVKFCPDFTYSNCTATTALVYPRNRHNNLSSMHRIVVKGHSSAPPCSLQGKVHSKRAKNKKKTSSACPHQKHYLRWRNSRLLVHDSLSLAAFTINYS